MIPAQSQPPPRITWQSWLADNGLTELVTFPADVGAQIWNPTDVDRDAAWKLYTEFRTRVTTQPLPYRSGVEEAALDSIVKLFDFTRKVLSDGGRGCRHCATTSAEVLNIHVRPFTRKWHKLRIVGLLEMEDGRHRFRRELRELQKILQLFLELLGRLAEADDYRKGTISGAAAAQSNVSLGDAIAYEKMVGLPAIETGNAPASELIEPERREILIRRTHYGLPGNTDNLVGLAISGGGIRSATFAQGVLQGISDKHLLKEVDFLSTVSGGGYIGAFLSSYLNATDENGHAVAGVGPDRDDFPFKKEGRCESSALRLLRNNSKYLLLRGFFGRLSMVWQGLFGVCMNLSIVLSVIILAVLISRYAWVGLRITEIASLLKDKKPVEFGWADWRWSAWVAGAFGFAFFMLPLIQKFSRNSTNFQRISSYHGWLTTGLFGLALGMTTVESIPLGYWLFAKQINTWNRSIFDVRSVPNILVALLGSLITFIVAHRVLLSPPRLGQPPTNRYLIVRKIAYVALAISGPLILILLYFILCHELLVGDRLATSFHLQPDTVIWILTIFALCYWFFINVNLISPHRYYRDRLAQTYLLRPSPTNLQVAVPVDPQLLSTLGKTNKAPYHLINAALNLPASKNPELRGRDADFFIFSKLFCGSPIVGYAQTKDWEAADRFLDLGTAIAISGAAASAQMGARSSLGSSFYLALLNVRLGYWLFSPMRHGWFSSVDKLLGGPGPLYLLREMFGYVHEKNQYLNVSDGGHIENLGVYELLRRRCKFIIAIDGEADPALEFPSLMKLQEFAWIDFGTQIEIDVSLLRLTARHFSQVHFSMGRVLYPEGKVGFLLYIKSSVSGNERDEVLDYRAQSAISTRAYFRSAI